MDGKIERAGFEERMGQNEKIEKSEKVGQNEKHDAVKDSNGLKDSNGRRSSVTVVDIEASRLKEGQEDPEGDIDYKSLAWWQDA